MATADMNSQAFWNDFMRRPEAKEAYQADRKLQMKKQMWLEEKRLIEERGVHRKILGEALEASPAEIKKLIAPMFHIKVVEQFLWMLYDECQTKQVPFLQKLQDESTMVQLRKLRENFQQGGEERMKDLESNFLSICGNIIEEEAKKEVAPMNADVHTLKQVLEVAQECKRLGNEKFREGKYEEALKIYDQGDEVMKKWKVGDHLKTEKKWLEEYHIACLKNKAQAALKLDLFQTALDAADAALKIDDQDHKAWYRKVHAQKGLGYFKEAEESLNKLEEVAESCPDRRSILRDCEVERQRIRAAVSKHKQGTKDMLGKAFENGLFSSDRDKAVEDELEQRRKAALAESERETPKKITGPPAPLERNIQLTEALACELLDELATAYGQQWYQERVQKCARDSAFEKMVFLRRLKTIAFEIQKPILEKWGFDPSEQGLREMQAAIRDLSSKDGTGMPPRLKERQERCLKLLYGGEEGGMLGLLM
mmetsp:Transcript_95994/g.210062  ORF Transcript_95994/g.210062 Transcript_95994/m.210062 type:complete len:482 (-) Transcript_95994:594-2039(-)|eukprot:CAMPEP_0206423286 /NCGR_PEP_ID=MMETSP0324_2-20121206/2598_1 /ASSEMBLY_ACC=CAM_ASM_000836 /TAXON_ID=2866 /ORGANISM="Crypthecodinium cohnii, Strain Seligo" /LENGTH=481 /DNA_ID=CAMNT_0053887833 /DNA_START=168 /DNA_END=1613 /DNA_ORIENTATION=+